MAIERFFTVTVGLCPDGSDGELATRLHKGIEDLTLFDIFDSIDQSKKEGTYGLLGSILAAYDEIDLSPGWKTHRPIDVDGALKNYNDVQKLAMVCMLSEIIRDHVKPEDIERLCKEICFTNYTNYKED